MTKKHFEALARILNRHRVADAAPGFDEGYDAAAHSIAEEIADYLGSQNPRFDRQKFLDAAGIE